MNNNIVPKTISLVVDMVFECCECSLSIVECYVVYRLDTTDFEGMQLTTICSQLDKIYSRLVSLTS